MAFPPISSADVRSASPADRRRSVWPSPFGSRRVGRAAEHGQLLPAEGSSFTPSSPPARPGTHRPCACPSRPPPARHWCSLEAGSCQVLHQAANGLGIVATADPQSMPVGQFQLNHARGLDRRRGRRRFRDELHRRERAFSSSTASSAANFGSIIHPPRPTPSRREDARVDSNPFVVAQPIEVLCHGPLPPDLGGSKIRSGG